MASSRGSKPLPPPNFHPTIDGSGPTLIARTPSDTHLSPHRPLSASGRKITGRDQSYVRTSVELPPLGPRTPALPRRVGTPSTLVTTEREVTAMPKAQRTIWAACLDFAEAYFLPLATHRTFSGCAVLACIGLFLFHAPHGAGAAPIYTDGAF